MAEKIRILVVDDIAETRENLAKLIGFETDMEIVAAAEGGKQAIALAKRDRPDVILMDINMPDMDGIQATEIIASTVPESPIIMMSVQGEQDYLRRSMLAGAREFLVKPFSSDELVRAIRHVHELEKAKRARYAQIAPGQYYGDRGAGSAPAARGRVISFFSPKGGVGRTTIATNLAVALHQSTGKPVCLVDGSLPFGDIGVILNMPPKAKTIAVLLAPPNPEIAELISGPHMKRVLETLREKYAFVVVDTWPSFQEQVLSMLDVADVILTLMTLEITNLKNVRVFLEIAEKLGYDDHKVQLVANRNDSLGGIKASDFETSLARKIPHSIVSDGRALVLAVNRGVPFVVSHRDSQVSKDIFTLAAKLAADEDAEATGPTPQKAQARQGLRIFAR